MADSRIPAEVLELFIDRVVQAMGADSEVAAEVARHLVHANLAGHDSHGVVRLPQDVAQAARGELRPAARPILVHESAATALIDSQRGFGHYSTSFALSWAMERARQQGIAAVAIRHSGHIGRLGEYTENAGRQGLIAIVTAGAAGPGVGGMNLYGSRERFFGANPWSINIPVHGRAPVVFDGSTSAVAEGKVMVARSQHALLPPGCIVDREGRPSTNPDDFYDGGALVPLGGEVAGHKGYGLALASALLSGLAMIDDPEPTLMGAPVVAGQVDTRGRVAGVFISVIDPASFGDRDSYMKLTSETVAAAKRVPPEAGHDEILVPGDRAERARGQNARTGVELPASTWADLAAIASRFEVALP
jgi:uncharacterized oxidoreductase